MEALDAILSRRSIRRYTGEPVGAQTVTRLLEAAMAAPSAGNQQPWHFIVVEDHDVLGGVPSIHPHAAMVPSAAVAIIVCADTTSDRYPNYWIQDCAAATENILIAARSLGLGAVWLGIHPREERVAAFRRMFAIPGHVTPLSMISLGRPAEEKPPANRYDASRVRYDRW